MATPGNAATAARQPVVASSSASSIFASKLPLIEAFTTPIPDHEIAAHTRLITSVRYEMLQFV